MIVLNVVESEFGFVATVSFEQDGETHIVATATNIEKTKAVAEVKNQVESKVAKFLESTKT